MIKKIFILIILLLLLPINSYSDFIVKTIYFKPIDAPELTKMQDKISKIVNQSQEFYQKQFELHGYNSKTFRVERNKQNKIIIHLVEGKHNSNYYINESETKIAAELPHKFDQVTAPSNEFEAKKFDSINLIIIGGVELLDGKYTGYGGHFAYARYGGSCLIAGSNPLLTENTISHELGHCFGLYHQNSCNICTMAPGVLDEHALSDFEVRWLNKHYHFNNRKRDSDLIYPKINNKNYIITYIDKETIKFELEVTSTVPLYQAHLIRTSDAALIGWDILNGKLKENVEFEIKLSEWANEIYLHVMDNHGNFRLKTINTVLPEKLEVRPKAELTVLWAKIKINSY